jgi:cell division septation protein DedD
VLGALAVVVVIAVPYILQWLETSSPDRPAMTDTQVTRPAPAPPTQIETAPAAPSAPAPAVATAPIPPAKEPPAAKDVDPAKDAPAAKEMPAAKEPSKAAASAPRSELPAKAATATAPGPVAKDMPASKPPAKAPPVTARAAAPPPAAPTRPLNGGGSYWVQVGLFENAGNAERLAQDLRANRFAVQVAQVSRGGAVPAVSRHEVFVTGSSVDAVTAALKGSGTAQAVTGGVAVRPALDLKDAVTLSRRLASEGLEVRIRRTASAPAGSGATVHLVRVGDYDTPAEAQAGKKQLAAKGIGGFVTQGAAK